MSLNLDECLARLVTRRVEDWWCLGSRVLRRSSFPGAVLSLAESKSPISNAEARALMGRRSAPIRVLSVALAPEHAGTWALVPMVRYPHQAMTRYVLDLDGGFEQYQAGLASSGRRKLKRSLEKYLESNEGRTEFRTYRLAAEVEEFVGFASQVTRKTYQWKHFHMGIDESPATLHRLTLDAAADAFRGYVLLKGGQPIAFNSAYAVGDILIGDLMGYDPAFATSNPGFAAMNLMLRSVFEDRFRRLEFGLGDFDYKRELATGSYVASDVFFFRPSLRNWAWVIAHRAFHGSQRAASRLVKGSRNGRRTRSLT